MFAFVHRFYIYDNTLGLQHLLCLGAIATAKVTVTCWWLRSIKVLPLENGRPCRYGCRWRWRWRCRRPAVHASSSGTACVGRSLTPNFLFQLWLQSSVGLFGLILHSQAKSPCRLCSLHGHFDSGITGNEHKSLAQYCSECIMRFMNVLLVQQVNSIWGNNILKWRQHSKLRASCELHV